MIGALKKSNCQELLNVSRETIDRFDIYLRLLTNWQKNLNLVGSSTLVDPWRRHILDCAQLSGHIENINQEIVDVGSGAGMPGVILSILGYKNVLMVESDYKKTVFITEALRVCNIKARVSNSRIEKIKTLDGKTVVSRAFAPIEKTFNLLGGKIGKETRFVFLKGKNAKKEIVESEKKWKKKLKDYTLLPKFNTYKSLSNYSSFIVNCTFKTSFEND